MEMEMNDHVVGTESLKKCVVLGGLGFVGRPLVLRLLKLGNWIVRVADSVSSLQHEPSTDQASLLSEAISARRLSYVQLDLRCKSQIVNAIEGSSVVFFTEMGISPVDNFYHCYKVIVQGAKNVISACRECKVKQLIYNSSADVVFDGSQDIHDGDESLPYPMKFEDMLIDLRSQAEALVLLANDIDGLITCVLRPSNVFGPGDTQLVPKFLDRAIYDWQQFIIGSGENVSDFTYVENVAHALICTEDALSSKMASVAGKAFFVTNLEPVKFWVFTSLILEGLGYRRPLIKVPAMVVSFGYLLVKWTQEKLGLKKHNHPSSDRFIQLASRSRTFNCSEAQKHIKYSPIVSMDEGIKLTVEAFSHLARGSSFLDNLNEQSKVDKLLGGGKVADILLWRDEKVTFTCFLVLVLLFYWFFLCGRTFVTSAAELLLLAILILYGHGLVSSNIFGFNMQNMFSPRFEVSENVVRDSSTVILLLSRKWVKIVTALAKGEDWNIFLKVTISLIFLRMISSCSLTVVICSALVLAFMSFFIYEQYEYKFDGLVEVLCKSIKNMKGLLMKNLPVQ